MFALAMLAALFGIGDRPARNSSYVFNRDFAKRSIETQLWQISHFTPTQCPVFLTSVKKPDTRRRSV
jgi:hypothetical protein